MKRLLICIISLGIFLSSCHKDNSVNPPTAVKKAYSVKFNVGFASSTDPFVNNAIKTKATSYLRTASVDTLQIHITTIYYILYDSTGTAVRRITQSSTDTSFGVISDKIPSGKYTVAVIAGNGNLQAVGLGTNGQPIAGNDWFGYLTNNGNSAPWKDTFFKKFAITVSGSTSNYNVSLDRIVAKLEVNIEDALPSGAALLQFKIRSDDKGIHIQDTIPLSGYSPFYRFTNVVPGATNTNMTVFIANTTSPFSVEITCTDGVSTIYADKTITNVTCTANQETLLTGTLFGEAAGNGFNVTYNPTWNPTPVNIGF